MPDVGLFTATEPLPADARVIIKYAVEVEGLPVYSETYDVAKIAQELEADERKAIEIWSRRIKCVVHCRHRNGFSSCLTRCLADGEACDCGHEHWESVQKGPDLPGFDCACRPAMTPPCRDDSSRRPRFARECVLHAPAARKLLSALDS